MPRLPAPEDYGTSIPRPTRGFVDLPNVQPDLYTGKVMAGIGVMMEQEAEKIDDALAQDALNQLQDQQLDLTYGDNGFTKLQGTQVTDRPVVQEYSDKMRITTEGLAAKINSPRVKQKFQLAAADVTRGFKQKLAFHTTAQVEKIKEQAFFGGAATAQRMAGEGDLDGAVKHMAPLLAAAVAEKGLTGDAAAMFARETMGAVYAANISKLVDTDRTTEAKAVFEANKGLMTEAQVKAGEKLIKDRSDYTGGVALSREAEALGLTGKKAFDYIVEKAGDNKNLMTTAKGLFQESERLIVSDAQETTGGILANFYQAGATHKAAADARTAMNKANVPARFRDNVESALLSGTRSTEANYRSAKAFDRAEEQRENLAWIEDPAKVETFNNLMGNPDGLVQYTENQLLGFAIPAMGKPAAMQLVKERKRFMSENTKVRFTEGDIKAGIPTTLQQTKTEAEKMQRARLEAMMHRGLSEWKDKHPGTVPTVEEKNQIMVDAAGEWRRIDEGLFTAKLAPGYKIEPGEKAVPSAFYKAAQASGQFKTEQEIYDYYQFQQAKLAQRKAK